MILISSENNVLTQPLYLRAQYCWTDKHRLCATPSGSRTGRIGCLYTENSCLWLRPLETQATGKENWNLLLIFFLTYWGKSHLIFLRCILRCFFFTFKMEKWFHALPFQWNFNGKINMITIVKIPWKFKDDEIITKMLL